MIIRLKIVLVISFQKSSASKIGVPKKSPNPLNKIVNSSIYAYFNLFINNTFSLNLFFFNSGFKAKVVRAILTNTDGQDMHFFCNTHKVRGATHAFLLYLSNNNMLHIPLFI